jgi:small subunit ribosomal protein S5
MSEETLTTPIIPEASEAAETVAPTLSSSPSRGGRGDNGGRRDDRGGKGGRRDDRRGGKSGFEPVKKEFEEVLLEVGRVTKVTSGGRQLRFRAAVVIGDRKGRVGFGLGKAQEVSVAVEKAVNSAKRHMIKVPLENGTVPYQVATKFKSVKIMIHPAAQGTGIIAGGSARRILELAGCQNILSKRHGGRNVITTAYATIEALKMYQVKSERPVFHTKDKVQDIK